MSYWAFCNSRDLTDNNRLITYGWDFSSFPLTCYFIAIVSVIPNGIFIMIFLWKIAKHHYPSLFTGPQPQNSESSDADVPTTPSIPSNSSSSTVNPLAPPSRASTTTSTTATLPPNHNRDNNNNGVGSNSMADFQHSTANSSRASIAPEELAPVVRYTRWFLRRSAYIQCLTFNLFFLSCIGSTQDYTSGLFTYWVLNTIAWSLCGIVMSIELEDAHRYRFSVWPGVLIEFFFLVNMIAICATTVSMETASYHNRVAGQIIVVVGGIISTVSITLVGFIVLRKSRVCYYIFQDELYAPFNPSTMKRL